MAITFKNFTETPPGLYWYRVPDTGQRIPPTDGFYAFNDLEEAVAKHYRANAKVVPSDLRQQLIDQMCQHLPDGWCRDGNRILSLGVSLQNEFNRILQGTTTLVSWWLTGRQKVEPAEAERRASICSKCVFNQPIVGCSACNSNALQGLVNQVVGSHPTTVDATLNACQICGCSLRAKVWLPLDLLVKHMPEAQRAQFPPAHNSFPGCWLRAESTT